MPVNCTDCMRPDQSRRLKQPKDRHYAPDSGRDGLAPLEAENGSPAQDPNPGVGRIQKPRDEEVASSSSRARSEGLGMP